MNEKDKIILEMLKNGKSYTDIIAELSVSPSRIAVVKKRNVNVLSSTNDALLGSINKNKNEQNKEKIAVVPEVVHRTAPPPLPPPVPLIEKVVVEPRKRLKELSLKLGQTPPPLPPPPSPLSKKEVEEVEANHIVKVKYSDIKSVAGKPFLSHKSNSSDFSAEAGVIKKYLSLDGKRLYIREFLAFFNELQRLIDEKKITKSSKYAREIIYIQKELVKHINKNKHVKGKIEFRLDASDNFIKTARGTF